MKATKRIIIIAAMLALVPGIAGARGHCLVNGIEDRYRYTIKSIYEELGEPVEKPVPYKTGDHYFDWDNEGWCADFRYEGAEFHFVDDGILMSAECASAKFAFFRDSLMKDFEKKGGLRVGDDISRINEFEGAYPVKEGAGTFRMFSKDGGIDVLVSYNTRTYRITKIEMSIPI